MEPGRPDTKWTPRMHVVRANANAYTERQKHFSGLKRGVHFVLNGARKGLGARCIK